MASILKNGQPPISHSPGIDTIPSQYPMGTPMARTMMVKKIRKNDMLFSLTIRYCGILGRGPACMGFLCGLSLTGLHK